jgi:hypothetical protein
MIFSVLDGKPLTFNGCRAIVGSTPEVCCETVDSAGRDIQIVPIADLIPFVRAETAYKDNDNTAFADGGMIEQHIAWTLTDFTKQTGILSRKAKIDITANTREYLITPPAGEEVYRVTSVCVNGYCLQGYQGEQCCSNGKCYNERGGFTFLPPNKIVLDDATCKACGKIEVQYITHASNSACTIDKLLIDRFQEALTYGAAGRIRKMAGYPWSIPAKGLDLLREYKMAIDQYKLDDAEGHLNGRHQMQVYGMERGFGYMHHHHHHGSY